MGGGPYRELPKLFPQWSPPPLSLLHPSPGFQSGEAPPPNSSAGCLSDPATLPPPPQGRPPARPPASPSLAPWLWPLRAWRGSQAPHRSGQSSGQSQSVWQGCEFRIGWSCPRLWEEGAVRGGPVAGPRSPSFSLPASLCDLCPFCLTLRREEARCPRSRGPRSSRRRKAFWAPDIYSSGRYRVPPTCPALGTQQ